MAVIGCVIILCSFLCRCLQKVTKQQREIATFCIFEKRELYDGQFFKFLFRILTLSYIYSVWDISDSVDKLNESKLARFVA